MDGPSRGRDEPPPHTVLGGRPQQTPAEAGMDSLPWRPVRRQMRRPRRGGGSPGVVQTSWVSPMDAPQRRGSARPAPQHDPEREGRPAEAGVCRMARSRRRASRRTPRRGGGLPQLGTCPPAPEPEDPEARAATVTTDGRRRLKLDSPQRPGVRLFQTPATPARSRPPRMDGG